MPIDVDNYTEPTTFECNLVGRTVTLTLSRVRIKGALSHTYPQKGFHGCTGLDLPGCPVKEPGGAVHADLCPYYKKSAP